MKDNSEELIIAVLPEGVKNISDVFDSQDFKDFMSKQSSVPKINSSGIPSQHELMFGNTGVGKSYLTEYLKTLPQVNLETRNQYKNRTIVAFVK